MKKSWILVDDDAGDIIDTDGPLHSRKDAEEWAAKYCEESGTNTVLVYESVAFAEPQPAKLRAIK